MLFHYLMEVFAVKDGKKYLLAVCMAVLILIFCIALADGVFGIRGTVIEDNGGSYTVQTSDKTGVFVFWISMILIVGAFAGRIGWQHNAVCYPVYLVGYYGLSALFGSKMNHYFLEHSSTAWMEIRFGPDGVNSMLTLMLAQYAVYFGWRIILWMFGKIRKDKDFA